MNYSIGPDVNGVFFADFNGDGFPDLAVTYDGNNTVPGGIAILVNQGDGTFGSPVTYAGGTQATQFAVLDLNGDGALDIATASLDQTVTVLLGKGNGAFGPPARYTVGGSGQAIAIADFNGDGVPDIVSGTTLVLLGNGNGTFSAGGRRRPSARPTSGCSPPEIWTAMEKWIWFTPILRISLSYRSLGMGTARSVQARATRSASFRIPWCSRTITTTR